MVLLGVLSAVAILVFTYGAKGYDNWSEARATISAAKRKLGELERDKSRQAALAAMVPVFEVPQAEDKQKFLFRDRLHEQFKKAGIKTEPLHLLPARRPRNVPYRVLKIRCKGTCKLDQLLDFLASLKENPYCVGVEELRIQCDMKEPPERRKDKPVDFDLVVSTFVK
jgi:hypothetical protein